MPEEAPRCMALLYTSVGISTHITLMPVKLLVIQ